MVPISVALFHLTGIFSVQPTFLLLKLLLSLITFRNFLTKQKIQQKEQMTAQLLCLQLLSATSCIGYHKHQVKSTVSLPANITPVKDHSRPKLYYRSHMSSTFFSVSPSEILPFPEMTQIQKSKSQKSCSSKK